METIVSINQLKNLTNERVLWVNTIKLYSPQLLPDYPTINYLSNKSQQKYR